MADAPVGADEVTPDGLVGRLLAGGTAIAAAHGVLIGVLPVFLEDEGAPPGVIGVVVGAYAATMALSRPAAGRAFNRVPPARILLLSGILMLVAYVGYGVLPAGLALLGPRLLHGAAWGLFSMTAFAWIARRSDPGETGRRMGIYGMGTGVALVVTPALGLALYETTDFTTVVVVGLVSALLVIVLALRMPQDAFATDGVVDDGPRPWLGRILAVIFLAATTMGLLEAFLPALADERGVGSVAAVYACFGVALGVGRAFGGTASDRLGRLTVGAAGLVSVVLTFVLMQVASGTVAVAAIAVLYGLGVGAAVTAFMADVADRAHGDHQSRALGTATLGSDIGLATGALLGGALASASISLVNLGGGVLGAVAIVLLLSESARRQAPEAEPVPTTPP